MNIRVRHTHTQSESSVAGRAGIKVKPPLWSLSYEGGREGEQEYEQILVDPFQSESFRLASKEDYAIAITVLTQEQYFAGLGKS